MDEEAAGGKTYYYKLTAISEKGTRSATSASKAAKSICTAPVADITSDGVTGKPLLLWEKVEGKEFTIEEMAQYLVEEYGIDMELALTDAGKLAQAWIDAGIAE